MPLSDLDLSLSRWLLFVTWGAFIGLDGISWPQAMLSRPIVAGTIGGLLFGDAAAGFVAGAFLEILAFRHPPYGAARYPDTGPAGLVAGAGYAAGGGEGLYPLLTVLLAGWAIGWVGAHAVHLLRKINGILVGDPQEAARTAASLRFRHHLAMRLDAVRAGLITAAFLVPVAFVAMQASGIEAGRTGERWTTALVVVAIAGLGGAGARGLGMSWRRWPLVTIGAVVGLILWR